jgi:1-acyl-sn-glycerol-3-phosphate acyltransferase
MGFKLTPGNIIFAFYVFLMAILSPLLFFPAVFINLLAGRNQSDRYINRVGTLYARHLFFMFSVKVNIVGLERLPETDNICFVSNHQGLADIPLIVGFVPKTVGFIAKKELGRIPILNVWMKAMGCILINRSNIRQSLTVIERGRRQIEKGHPMVIFPEGTRSRSVRMGRFKPGAFKLVSGTDALVVPITINGTYQVLEATGKITPTTIDLTIHPAIEVSKLNHEEKKALPGLIHEQIKKAL